MAMPEEVKRETLDFSQLMIHMGIGRDALKKADRGGRYAGDPIRGIAVYHAYTGAGGLGG